MLQWFPLKFYWACDYISIVGLKLLHICRRGVEDTAAQIDFLLDKQIWGTAGLNPMYINTIRNGKDYVYGIWVQKVLGICKGYYRVKRITSFMHETVNRSKK